MGRSDARRASLCFLAISHVCCFVGIVPKRRQMIAVDENRETLRFCWETFKVSQPNTPHRKRAFEIQDIIYLLNIFNAVESHELNFYTCPI